jgi:hypothetical protein
VNVFDIVREHYRTLYDLRHEDRTSKGDVVLFYLIPLVISSALVALRIPVASASVSLLLTCLSIFIGLLFNLLVLAHAMRRREGEPSREYLERRLLREINVNLEYSIFVALVALCVLLVSALIPHRIEIGIGYKALGEMATWVALLTYFLTCNFVLTLFMILNRMHTLLMRDYDGDEVSAPRNNPRTNPKTASGNKASVGTSTLATP